MTDAVPRSLNSRQRPLWELFDFASGEGLEIGPLHSPVVPPGYADVRFVDVFDRETLQANYVNNPVVDIERIPPIDFVLKDGDRVRTIPEAVGDETRFDWVMASHVLEHVPDLVAWLAQIAAITRDGGALVLAVPDRRYCFDLHRPPTSVGQLLQAHELAETTPSIRAVYDHNRSFVTVTPKAIWAGEKAGYDLRRFDLTNVQLKMDRARSGEYLDSHVWLFTPDSFLEQIVELRRLELSEWRVERLVPTRRDQLEFYAILRRLPRAGWGPELLANEPALPALPEWLAEPAEAHTRLAEAHNRLAELERRLTAADAKVARLSVSSSRRVARRIRARARTVPGYPLLRAARRRLRQARR